MKLIKLSEEHYIICDDSEIKKGDWVVSGTKTIVQCMYPENVHHRDVKKITHSTQPLEDVGLNTSMGCQLGFDKIEPLYLSEVKELLGVVDVEKKIPKYHIGRYHYSYGERPDIYSYKKGYNQALEDNKDKVSLKDLKRFLGEGRYKISKDAGGNITADFTELMSLLTSPKKEWDVEFVDGKLKLV